MKILLLFLAAITCQRNFAQAPPRIEWQRCFGGTGLEAGITTKVTADGGYIIGNYTTSDDGDVTDFIDSVDIWIVKTDALGYIEWKKCIGGTGQDQVSDILQTSDGGYIILGFSRSMDGDVTGNHGGYDIWVAKLSASGTIQWQRSYGSPANDGMVLSKICNAVSGGYIILSQVNGNGGDVTDYHPSIDPLNSGDLWVFKIDFSGNLVWSKCLGGSLRDSPGALIPTADGSYVLTGVTTSLDGNISCGVAGSGSLWMAKMDDAGTLLWQKCLRVDASTLDGRATSDGGFIFTGGGWLGFSVSDIYVLKTDGDGVVQWEKLIGGSRYDVGYGVIEASDGGFVVTGATSTAGEIICNFRGGYDLWLLKLSYTGEIVWQKTYGGTMAEEAFSIEETPDMGFVVVGHTASNDGDIDNSIRRGYSDTWMIKFSFPGIEIIPEITITASETNICPDKKVFFSATCIDEGDAPVYQWQVNGTNVGSNNSSVELSTLSDGDIVTCQLTSNAPCVTQRSVLSNAITINVDPSQTPVNFLGIDTAICDYGTITLRASGSYKSYLWNTGSTTPVLIIKQPGEYWLNVMASNDCPGVDTVIVAPKECLKGFFMPTAFTPNNDGKNDVLKPILGGRIKEYQFSIFNRWGELIFQTSDPTQGWDGTQKGLQLDAGVYIWTCQYQFEGEAMRLEKGTAAIIR